MKTLKVARRVCEVTRREHALREGLWLEDRAYHGKRKRKWRKSYNISITFEEGKGMRGET